MRVEFEMDLPARRVREPRGASPSASRTAVRALSQRERMARQLALAYHLDALVLKGEIADLAALARLCGLSRARISQIHDLLALPTPKQERILAGLAAETLRPLRP